jgi:hypothetical protein
MHVVVEASVFRLYADGARPRDFRDLEGIARHLRAVLPRVFGVSPWDPSVSFVREISARGVVVGDGRGNHVAPWDCCEGDRGSASRPLVEASGASLVERVQKKRAGQHRRDRRRRAGRRIACRDRMGVVPSG